MLSGERCFDETLARQVGVQPDEYLAGFISVGTIKEAPPQARETLSQDVWSCWQGNDLADLPAPPDQPILPSDRMPDS